MMQQLMLQFPLLQLEFIKNTLYTILTDQSHSAEVGLACEAASVRNPPPIQADRTH